jgi:hypothetical protein
MAGSSFGKKRAICVVQRKNLEINKKKFFFMGQGVPWEVKGHKGAPLC